MLSRSPHLPSRPVWHLDGLGRSGHREHELVAGEASIEGDLGEELQGRRVGTSCGAAHRLQEDNTLRHAGTLLRFTIE